MVRVSFTKKIFYLNTKKRVQTNMHNIVMIVICNNNSLE